MKFRNITTGEIRPAEAREDGIYLYDETTQRWYLYSLVFLAKNWEYYVEPKEYWYIDPAMVEVTYNTLGNDEDVERFNKEIGNYFDTREEAEKAVESLKAWTRLKDSGFKFTGFEETDRGCLGDFTIYCCVKPDYTRPYDEVDEDLDLLFGGGE